MLQLTDCPTSLSGRESACLQRYASGRRVVEAGSLLGGSTIQLAKVAAHVVSIDKHSGYNVPTHRRFRSNLLRASVSHKVESIIGDALLQLPKHKSDFTFLDLTGGYLLTKGALEAAQSEIVACHDVGRVHCSGVEIAIRELGYEILEHIDTLVVCRRPL